MDTTTIVVIFFIAFLGYAITTGLIGPVYGDFLAKAITTNRGWFYGIVQLLGGLLGFSAALVAENIIRTSEFPQGIQLCFWICFALSFLSIFFVAGLKEEEYPHPEPRTSLAATIAEVPALVAGDKSYARFIVARCVLAFSTLGIGFVVVDGLNQGVLRPSDAALLAAVFILSQAVLGFLLSIVGNYLGWKLVEMLGEGTFHQYDGGAAASRTFSWQEMDAQYAALRGSAYRPPTAEPIYVGRVPGASLSHLERSASLARERLGLV